jgi:hypothetical protein
VPRPSWDALEPALRARITLLVGGRIVDAASCPGGFSPGFASRLHLAGGRRVFVKAIDARRWPHEVAAYRAEARINKALPGTVPAPRLLGTIDDDNGVVLAFEDVDGVAPGSPWSPDTLDRVVEATVALGRVEAPIEAFGHARTAQPDHPRLGGWTTLSAETLAPHDPWAAAHLPRMVELERAGLDAARGDSIAHCDLYPHNILLTPGRVMFVDWPHARRGSNVIDLVTVLGSALADALDPGALDPDAADPDAALRRHAAHIPRHEIDAVLAAHAGFLVSGGLAAMPPGLEPIAAAKRRLGAAAARWLRNRLSDRLPPSQWPYEASCRRTSARRSA